MHVQDALDRLDQIHDQLTRTEVYRGFRSPAVGLVGVLGLLAAAVQPFVADAATWRGFVIYWSAVAGLGVLVGFAAAVREYCCREDEFARRRTRRVLGQFLPCLMAGGAVTLGVVRAGPELLPFLPGLWAVLFGLGLVATRPHLPAAIGAIGVAYILSGSILLWMSPPESPSGWTVGGVFGIGHLATALVLWFDEGERDG